MNVKYITLSNALRKAIAKIQFFQELKISIAFVLILVDNQIAIDIANGTVINYTKAKHINIRYYAFRHYI